MSIRARWGVGIAILLLVASCLFAALDRIVLKKTDQGNAFTKSRMLQLGQAVRTYFTEYGKAPLARLPTTQEHIVISDHTIIDALIGSEKESSPSGLNPRRISFLTAQTARGDPEAGFRAGLQIDSDGGGELFDPWGNHYRIRLDLDGDGKIPVPQWDALGTFIDADVIVWCPGPDGIDNTSDDITTW